MSYRRCALVLAVLAFLSSTALAASAPLVGVGKTGLGPVLVAANRHTLYLFEKDKNGRSACSGTCAAFWPPLLVRGKVTAGAGVTASLLGTVKRADGGLQVTYKGHPLYLFSLDKKAGDTKGQGVNHFGAHWYAVTPSGAKATSGSSSSGSGGYGGYGK